MYYLYFVSMFYSTSHAEKRSDRGGETACGCLNTNLLGLADYYRRYPHHIRDTPIPSDVTSRALRAQTEIGDLRRASEPRKPPL